VGRSDAPPGEAQFCDSSAPHSIEGVARPPLRRVMRLLTRGVETVKPRQTHPCAPPRRRASCNQHIRLKGFNAQFEKEVKMSVQLQIEEMPSYLKATFNGATTTEEVAWQIDG